MSAVFAPEPLKPRAAARARFEPARHGDTPIAVRIRIALRVARPATSGALDVEADGRVHAPAHVGVPAPDARTEVPGAESSSEPWQTRQSQTPQSASAVASPKAASDNAVSYHARANVRQTQQPGMRRLELAELRDVPGAFGDPFRAVEVLPGIVPLISGLPYFYVRGSPPAGSVYYYDGIVVPSLYHLALGPAVIHPRMVGPLRLYAGVAPARYGRLTGGVIMAEGPPTPDGTTHGEVELRLLDLSGFLQTDAMGGTLTASGRYGYPGLLISLISSEIDVAYWDYQLRYRLPISQRDRIELISLGSYDRLSTGPDVSDTLALQFHRIEPRYIHHTPHDELGIALLFGWDRSALGETLEIELVRLAPRAWYEHHFDDGSRLRLSADAQGLSGGLERASSDDAAIDSLGFRALGKGLRGVVGAQQLELRLPLWTAFELQAGARVDAWIQQGQTYPAADPRVRAILHASPAVDVHVAGGLTHQPVVPIVPLPGLADYASARDLQSALQLETGVGVELPIDLHAELQLFVHRYKDLVFADTLANGSIDDLCEREACMGEALPSHTDGWAYGMELFLRRPFTHGLSGVISYTLAWATLERVLGLPYTPSWDVRHLVNAVLQWDIGAGFAIGLRGFLRSGKANGEFYLLDSTLGRNERRLPGFLRGDVQLSYRWTNSWAHMRFAVEWFNFTISREAIGVKGCAEPNTRCSVDYAPAIFAPNLSLRVGFR